LPHLDPGIRWDDAISKKHVFLSMLQLEDKTDSVTHLSNFILYMVSHLVIRLLGTLGRQILSLGKKNLKDLGLFVSKWKGLSRHFLTVQEPTFFQSWIRATE
jgi:hypothetical protein